MSNFLVRFTLNNKIEEIVWNGVSTTIVDDKNSGALSRCPYVPAMCSVTLFNDGVPRIKLREGSDQKIADVKDGTWIEAEHNNNFSIVIFCIPMELPRKIPFSSMREMEIGRNEHSQIHLSHGSVSRHHAMIYTEDDHKYIEDSDSTNGTYVNGKNVTERIRIKSGDVISAGVYSIFVSDDALTVFPGNLSVLQQSGKDNRQYKRSPRILSIPQAEVIGIEKAPNIDSTPQMNWMSVLMMPAISVALMVVLVLALGMSPIMLIMSGSMSVISAIVAVVNYNKQKKSSATKGSTITSKYREYLDSISQKISDAHDKQLRALFEANPAPLECLDIVLNLENRLWEKRPSDSDYLNVRVGLGKIKPLVYADYQRPKIVLEENELEDRAVELARNSMSLSDAPVLCNISAVNQIGIIGDYKDTSNLLRNILMCVTTTHAYDELKVIALVSKERAKDWDWIRWLPHSSGNGYQRYFFTTVDALEDNLQTIEAELNKRSSVLKSGAGLHTTGMYPHYLFIVENPDLLSGTAINKYVLTDAAIGCSSLFVAESMNQLPKECSQIIEVKNGNGIVHVKDESASALSFKLDQSTIEKADAFARSMASIAIDALQGSSSLPKSISFLEGYGISRPDQLNIEERWRRAKTFKSLSVPVAALPGGAIFDFDIHEKAHGVNGIVAGMPGSGKTEMVQTWLLSLAVNFSPQDLAFVLIDFKGTSLITPFRGIPHLAGSISDLDTSIERNLESIRNEIKRRERILDKYNDVLRKPEINCLNEAYAKGDISERLPVLIIVIDEYAEFKKTFPEFGAEIDSLTSKGRALGIFVVLMTQKPAGVVSAKSEDNVKFRWCLRVANASASREMLGNTDAASITTAGRAIIKVGEDDIYEQVQSFWSGAPYDPNRGSHDHDEIVVSSVDLSGSRVRYGVKSHKTKSASSNESEIGAVVKYICEYCKEHNIQSTERVWLDALPERVALPELLQIGFNGAAWPETEKTAPVIGLTDDPSNQNQYPVSIDFLNTGHIAVYGAPSTGKTTLLETLIVSLAMMRAPDKVSIYIMDFGGWNLNKLNRLPHVGGIANDNEPERLKKLAMLVDDMLQTRKTLFSQFGVGNISAYRDASGQQLPDIVLIVDNFGALLKLYPDMDAFFSALAISGANYGIYLVVTASATNAIPNRISQYIKFALALQLIDKSDYTYVVGKPRGTLPAIKGRGYIKDAVPIEFQTALPVPGADDKTVSQNICRLAEVMDACWSGDRPLPIPEMPEIIHYGSVPTHGCCLGLSLEKVVPVSYDYTLQHYILISGTDSSGKSNMLQVLSNELKDKLSGQLYVFDVLESGLSKLRKKADAYYTKAEEIDRFIEELRPELQRRQTAKQGGIDGEFTPIIITIDDYSEFFKVVSNESVARLLAIEKLGAGLGLYLLVAGDAYALSSMFNKGEAVATALAKGRQSILLGGCMNDHAAVSVKASYSQKSIAVREHEGLFVVNQEYTAFKAMYCDGDE